MLPRPSRFPLLPLLLAPLWGACGGGAPQLDPQDPLWSSVIDQHTTGEISRRGRIRVLFAHDIVEASLVGGIADEVLSVSPEIAASVRFVTRREIVLSPEGDLKPGRTYVVTIEGGSLAGIPESLDRYQFAVRVMEQGLDVGIAGLMPDPEQESHLMLLGTVTTADVDEADRVEQIVGTTFRGQALELSWRHDRDGRRHEFSAAGIERGEADEDLTISWDGAVIGVSLQGERSITVPAAALFVFTRVEAVQEQRQYVLVQFSDALDPRQNLNGLVSLGGIEFTANIRGNELRLYPARRATGEVTVSLQPGLRSRGGKLLDSSMEASVAFSQTHPGVRFAGTGNILPDGDVLSVPIEAVNVHSVQVTAFRIDEANMGQFLQTNTLGGSSELSRVGRYLWRRTIPLTSPIVDQWNRYSLDLTELMREHPADLVRLTLSINRGNSLYTCSEEDEAIPVMEEPPLRDADDYRSRAVSAWDGVQSYYAGTLNLSWSDRENPCRDAYFRWSDRTTAERNFIASNLGLVAKRDRLGSTLVTVTNLRTSEPVAGAIVTFMNFQDRPMAERTTNGDGMVRIALESAPFYVSARKEEDRGYLKMNAGSALATSHFDVGGTTVGGGLKGLVYGERGVWRPGDTLNLTFVAQSAERDFPPDHPATLRLFDPRGQQVHSVTHTTPTDGFYAFRLATASDAPTGTWRATVDVGGSRFSTPLEIETVVPNRLKVELDLGEVARLQGGEARRASLHGQWLSGAVARGLNADVEVTLRRAPTRFDRFMDYTFDDPARTFGREPAEVFEGALDRTGAAEFDLIVPRYPGAPGFLTATFSSRVFEPGGAFSTNRQSVPFSPFSRYVGVRIPAGDARRGMLLTDTTHVVGIATLDADGEPVSVEGLEVTLYKIGWKWWWDRSGESLAQYTSSEHRAVVETGVISTVDGRGSWPLRVDYPAWGRYFLRVCDPQGGHCTGRVFYIDWPGWVGRPQEQSGLGANVLTVTADRASYSVGDVAQIELPESSRGRALLTLENGSRILDARWVELREGRTRLRVPVTAEMSPSTYASVTLIQPHGERDNDRPMRLYGVIPLAVTDPETRLHPVIEAADEWRPRTRPTVSVSETSGRAMTYTLAVVDEGLLGLTNFETPDLHRYFYQKEALGVKTWDVFDQVVGAYGGELERLLALGGGGDEADPGGTEQSRYPPVVRFMGPFHLERGERNEHEVDLPQYIGSVRIMVVAGYQGAYGSASKSVFVREPLSLLATLPRVVGPEDELTIPVSLFAMTEDVRTTAVTVETDRHFEVVGSETSIVEFDGPGEKLALLRLRVGSELGQGRVLVSATSGEHSTSSEIFLTVRSPNPVAVRQVREEIEPGETWSPTVTPFGLAGTNRAVLELSSLPPLNLEPRLQYLIRYPHGCVEQVTSAVFPQLYLPSLLQLDRGRQEQIDANVRAAIERLRRFQVPTGAFTYWPGGSWFGTAFQARNSWATSYVGHFLIQAERRGYFVPSDMRTSWLNFQRLTAQSWSSGSASSAMDQAYRLYTLALAGQFEMGAMNRLRTTPDLGYAESWYLAATYALAGLPEVARVVAAQADEQAPEYERPGWSFGSRLRDQAIRLSALTTLGMEREARALAEEISAALYSDSWYSTHAVAYSLLAMADLYGVEGPAGGFSFELGRAGAEASIVRSQTPLHSAELVGIAPDGESLRITNVGDERLFGSVLMEGIPAAGEEQPASAGLAIRVDYADADGGAIDVTRLVQGTDFVVRVTVTNRTAIQLDNLALEHRLPAGWEILNPRMAGAASAGGAFEYQDIRDDRVHTYFSLGAGKSTTFTSRLHATYLGTYHLPSVSVEAMYDATKHARTGGYTVRVVGSEL